MTSEPGIGECRRYISVASVEVTGDDGTNGPVRRENSHHNAEFAGFNVQAGNPKVALVADDLVSTQPWTPSSAHLRHR